MGKENNHIDDLFSDKFDNFEFKTSPEEWSNLSSSLGKVNFFKFSFTSVNVYVVGAGMALASSGGYVGVKHIINSDKTEDIDNKIELVEPPKKIEEKVLLTDSSTFVIPFETGETEITLNEKDNDHINNTQNKEETIKEPVILKQEDNFAVDSVKIKTDSDEKLAEAKIDSSSIIKPDSLLIVPPRKVIRIKKKVFVKKDSVIRKKTVVIKK